MRSADSHAAQMAAAIVVAAHGHIGVRVRCECASVGPRLAAEGLAGAQPSAVASPWVAVESRVADDMQSAPRPDDLQRAGSVLEQATAIVAAVAVMRAGVPHSSRQPAGNSQPSEPRDIQNLDLALCQLLD